MKKLVWILLAEHSFSDFLSDQERGEQPAAGSLFQSLRELGMSPECMENIARALAGFAQEARARAKQGRLELPGRIRIFCQKKKGVGGWGYFMIARVEVLPPDSAAIPHSCVDLYLYKEGE
jgi:hypothetical protein